MGKNKKYVVNRLGKVWYYGNMKVFKNEVERCNACSFKFICVYKIIIVVWGGYLCGLEFGEE